MIESVSTECSIIDGKPTSYSPAHLAIRSLLGSVVAAKLTYEDEVRLHPPDEVNQRVEITRGTSDSLGAAG